VRPRPRVFAGGLATETNSFSPIPTGYDDFRRAAAGESQERRDTIFFGRSFRSYAAVAADRDVDLRVGPYSFATPAGPPARPVYERLRDELLAELDAARPVDGVLLTLHGAMTCEGIDDCESDIVERARELVGGSATVGVLLDLHCDLPPALLDAADAIVVVKEYPHVDAEPCARRLAEIVTDAIARRASPTIAAFDCRMVGVYPTVREPMRGFVDGVLHAAEREHGVLAASLAHGFMYLDGHPGAHALVVADGDRGAAARTAERIGRAFNALRRELALGALPLQEALDRALASGAGSGPVVLADMADNAGGGAPSDSTFALRALLEREVSGCGLGPLWDPVAVQLAFAAGEGSRLTVRLGGKIGPISGDPLDVTVTVRGLVHELVQRWPQQVGHSEIPMGAAAWLEADGVDVVVTTVREQAFGLELFTAFGIDPREKRLLVLKSANHFRAAYDPVAREVLYVDAGGALPTDPRAIPYTRFDRQAYPWVDDPLGEGAS
jgi:microcystin degradation protein MlrC